MLYFVANKLKREKLVNISIQKLLLSSILLPSLSGSIINESGFSERLKVEGRGRGMVGAKQKVYFLPSHRKIFDMKKGK